MGLTVSVVSPVYGGEATVREFARGVLAAADAEGITLELILVDDASPDGSWDAVRSVVASDDRVVGVRLAENVRQTRATFAGFAAARGDVVVAMDSDLEHPPSAVIDLLGAHRAGHDLVVATRRRAGASLARRAGSTALNAFSARLGLPVGDIGSSLLLMDRAVEATSRSALERTRLHLLLPAMWAAAEHPTTIEVALRDAGRSGYPLAALVGIAGQFVMHHVGSAMARPRVRAAVAGGIGLVGLMSGRRRVARSVLLAGGVGMLSRVAGKGRRDDGPLYVVSEVIDRRGSVADATSPDAL